MSNKKETKSIVAYKGFDKDLKCRGFQYEVGKTYEYNGDISLCNSGFHACENPFNVLEFYNLWENRFTEVEIGGEIKNDEKKSVASKITIKAELKLPGLIEAAIKFVFEKSNIKDADPERIKAASGDASQLAASGRFSKLAASGYASQLAASGDDSVAVAVHKASKISGKIGALVCLVHYDGDKPIRFVTGKIGENGLKENIWYGLDEVGNFLEIT